MCSTCLDRTFRYNACFGYMADARLQLSTSFAPTPRLGLVVHVNVLLRDSDTN
jgi:hypothetical protein